MQNFSHVAPKMSVLQPKNTSNLVFLALSEENIAKNSDLKFELEAEILHGYFLITLELMFKISGT